MWILVVWALVRLAGPVAFALRPSLWRWACVDVAHKTGALNEYDSWRLLFVKSQMGLLQEGVLALGLRPRVWGYLEEGQSGYLRSSDDPLLVLAELNCISAEQHRRIFANLGDFQKAFPSSWREDLLLLLSRGPQVQGGAFHLLSDILRLDVTLVPLSGMSIVFIIQGLPEGGVLGPILYPLIPDSLVRTLRSAGGGISIAPSIPQAWAAVQWSGVGCPQEDLVVACQKGLRGDAALPDATRLNSCPTMLASAAKALDRQSDRPLCALLHADDPVLFASSHGDMAAVLAIAAKWSWIHGALFHVGAGKSVVFVLGGGVHSLPPLFMEILPDQWVPLTYGQEVHRWLGWLWDWQGGANSTATKRCGTASAQLAMLAGLVTARAIPLPLALVLLQAKVDGALAPGRWLYSVMSPGGDEMLNNVWHNALRALVGAPPWTSGSALRWELGIPFSGAAKAIAQVALRRAYLWSLPIDDLYRRAFIVAQGFESSWASKSRRKLEDWGVPDFPSAGLPLSKYKVFVNRRLLDYCCAELVSALTPRRCSIPFGTAYPKRELPAHLQDALRYPLGWQCLVGTRSLCRLRLGLLPLAHRRGRHSDAKQRSCILCNALITSPVAHTLIVCPALDELRAPLMQLQVWGELDDRLTRLFSLSPGDEGFSELVSLAQGLDAAVVTFWKSTQSCLRVVCQ